MIAAFGSYAKGDAGALCCADFFNLFILILSSKVI
jgi:hypothetical protein